MIRKLHERIIQKEDRFRGGELTTTLSKFLTQEESCNTGRLFAFNTVPPKGSIGFHQHVNEYEIYVITKGKAVVTENDKSEHEMNIGDTMLCADGDWHAIRNAGDTDMEFLSLVLFTGK